MSDQELLALAQGGDRAAMERLLASLAPRLHRFGMRLCDSYADDALQNALLTIAEELPRFRGESELSSWAYSIVRTACGRLSRGKINTHTDPLDAQKSELSHHSDPERAMLHEERKEVFNCAMHSLPLPLREAVLLRDVEELTAEEAAQALSISVSALKSRLHRGRSALSLAIDSQLSLGPPKQGCPDVMSALSRSRENDLPNEELAKLEAHLAECRSCDECCQRLKQAISESRGFNGSEHERDAMTKSLHAAYARWSQGNKEPAFIERKES